MDSQDFRTALTTLGETQRSFAARLGVGRRTVQTWSAEGPPSHIGILVEMLLAARRFKPVGPGQDGCVSCAAAVVGPLDTLVQAAEAAGWSRPAIIAAIEDWLAKSRH